MALDHANAGQLPNPPTQYSQQHIRQMIRVLEIYFSQLDSDMPNHAEQYTAKRFVGGNFYGGMFFGNGNFLGHDIQRFNSLVDQSATAVDVTSIVSFGAAEFSNSITLVAPGKMTVSLPGKYKVSYQLGFGNNAAAGAVNIWLRKNGVNIANTNAQFTVPAASAIPASFSLILTLVAGDFVEIGWAPSNTGILLKSKAPFAGSPGVAPPIPATPSAVVVMELLQADIPVADILPLPRRLRPRHISRSLP